MQNDTPIVSIDRERGELTAHKDDIEDADRSTESGHLPITLRRTASHRPHFLRSGHQFCLASRRGICKER